MISWLLRNFPVTGRGNDDACTSFHFKKSRVGRGVVAVPLGLQRSRTRQLRHLLKDIALTNQILFTPPAYRRARLGICVEIFAGWSK